jgi:hypothetical protein
VEPRGQVGHEIVFVFTAAFADEAAYEIGEQGILDTPERIRVIWRPPGLAVRLCTRKAWLTWLKLARGPGWPPHSAG